MTNVEKASLISQIIKRADIMDILQPTKEPRFTLYMDLVYSNEDIPLDYQKLLKMDDANFAHDIIGIQYNFNRVTKKMDNFFLPRCSMPSKE